MSRIWSSDIYLLLSTIDVGTGSNPYKPTLLFRSICCDCWRAWTRDNFLIWCYETLQAILNSYYSTCSIPTSTYLTVFSRSSLIIRVVFAHYWMDACNLCIKTVLWILSIRTMTGCGSSIMFLLSHLTNVVYKVTTGVHNSACCESSSTERMDLTICR